MPYIVTNTDGSLTVTISDQQVDTSTYSLALLGQGVSNYGQFIAQNTIRHLENFASTVAPSPGTRLVGQLWYDKGEGVIRVWDGNVWKRATNISVGPESARPTTGLAGGGAAFFNTSTNKLEVHNGTTFKDAGYGGEVTSVYSADAGVDNPSFYGARVRTLFITDENGDPQPVLAFSYVKTTNASGANRGATQIGEQYETIMGLFSDTQFQIRATANGGTATPVDGTIVDFAPELIDPDGILSSRSGKRISGRVLPGLNVRAEYETSGVVEVETLFANAIGSPSDPVSTIDVSDINVYGQLEVASLDVGNSITAGGDISADGDITAATGVGTFANLVVTANSTLNGETTINGQLTVNGVNTQIIGAPGNVIEDFYGGNITTDTLVVSTTANVNIVNATTLNITGGQTVGGNLDVTGTTTLAGTTATTLTATGAVDFDDTLNVDGVGTFNDVVNFLSDINMNGSANINLANGVLNGAATQTFVGTNNGTNETVYLTFVDGQTGVRDFETDNGLTYNPSTNTLSTTIFNGTATQAQYADLAEIYIPDAYYEPGTVVKLGGQAEITQTTSAEDIDVFGVVSTDPAFLMNSGVDGAPVAMTGRVPVKVTGEVAKGERLVSSDIPGVAQAYSSGLYDPRAVIGRSLVEKTTEGEGVIEAVIGVK